MLKFLRIALALYLSAAAAAASDYQLQTLFNDTGTATVAEQRDGQSVAIDAAGSAHAVFTKRYTLGNGSDATAIEYAFRDSPTHAWSVENVANVAGHKTRVSLKVDNRGTLYLAYAFASGHFFTMRPQGGSWSTAETVSTEFDAAPLAGLSLALNVRQPDVFQMNSTSDLEIHHFLQIPNLGTPQILDDGLPRLGEFSYRKVFSTDLICWKDHATWIAEGFTELGGIQVYESAYPSTGHTRELILNMRIPLSVRSQIGELLSRIEIERISP